MRGSPVSRVSAHLKQDGMLDSHRHPTKGDITIVAIDCTSQHTQKNTLPDGDADIMTLRVLALYQKSIFHRHGTRRLR